MKSLIVSIFFMCVYVNSFAQNENVLDSMILQSLDCYFHRFDDCEIEWIRNRYSNNVKYVCNDGLPFSLRTDNSSGYYFHDKDYATIRKLEKTKHEGILSVFVGIKLYGDTIAIPIRDVSISYKSRHNGLVLLSDGDEYRFIYNLECRKWIMIPKQNRYKK